MAQGYRLFVCRACNFAYLDPDVSRSLPTNTLFGDEYFTAGGAGYPNYLEGASLLREHGRRYGAILRRHVAGVPHVLDVGCAAGFTLQGMIDAGCSGVGIEPNAAMAGFAAHELGLDVHRTTLEAFSTADRFDCITMLQTVAHVEDIELSFARVAALTRPSGYCLVEFGNRSSLVARLFRAHWHENAPPSVRRVFSLRSLRKLLTRFGFELAARGWPRKDIRVGHAASLIEYLWSDKPGASYVKRLTALIPATTTLRYPGDDITWALFRKRAAAG